jgi:hypothetical protein
MTQKKLLNNGSPAVPAAGFFMKSVRRRVWIPSKGL